jgi:hypothetical protein
MDSYIYGKVDGGQANKIWILPARIWSTLASLWNPQSNLRALSSSVSPGAVCRKKKWRREYAQFKFRKQSFTCCFTYRFSITSIRWKRNSCIILVEEPEGKRTLGETGRCSWESNIKSQRSKGCGFVQDRIVWMTHVKTIMKSEFDIMQGISLLAEHLSVSQSGLYCQILVSFYVW